MPFRLLVVDADPVSRSAVVQALTAAGSLVTCASDFEEAKKRLSFAPPDLLVASIQLGTHNGLHLVVRAQADNPGMPAIVFHSKHDPVLEDEAAKVGAAYLTTPLDEQSLVSLVAQLLTQSNRVPAPTVERRWPRKTVQVTARIAGADATVVDVSYGGLRLELSGVPDERLSRISTVYIPDLGFLQIHPIWARGGAFPTGRWWCGAEVTDGESRDAEAWRRFVDSLN